MSIDVQLLPVNRFSRPGRKLDEVRAVVMHWVASPGSSANAISKYFARLRNQDPNDQQADRYASAHYIVGISGEVLQVIPEDEMAYHCGSMTYTQKAKNSFGIYASSKKSPNQITIGVELCHPFDNGEFAGDTLTSAVNLVADICLRNHLDPIHDIWRHFDVVGWKKCPLWWVDHEIEFEDFKIGVNECIDQKIF
jgi:N-acetylmuramoyl-L-alanine amidase